MSTRTLLSNTALLALIASPAVSQTVELIQDFTQTPVHVSSKPAPATMLPEFAAQDSFVKVGNSWFFEAKTIDQGKELFRTDGTAVGTFLVKDIGLGEVDAELDGLTELNGVLYFVADDGVHGDELWRSDGTEAGTFLVRDIRPGGAPAGITSPITFMGKLYFFADDGVHGNELWVSNGSAGGTRLFFHEPPGPTVGYPNSMAVNAAGDVLYFIKEGKVYRTDGTSLSTHEILSPVAGTNFSQARGLFPYQGGMVFTAKQDGLGYGLFLTDGTSAGTIRLRSFAGFDSAEPLLDFPAEFQGDLYFSLRDPAVGWELHRTDGTQAGTVLVQDIWPGSKSSTPSCLTVWGGALYFISDAISLGRELWRFDGTSASIVANLAPASNPAFDLEPGAILANGGLLYLALKSGGLAISDGTTAGTHMLGVTPQGAIINAHSLTPLASGAILFSGVLESGNGELFQSDGTGAGTSLVADLEPTAGSESSQITGLYSPDGRRAYINIDNDDSLAIDHRSYLWDPNATPPVTQVADVGASGALVGEITSAWLGGKEVFLGQGTDPIHGRELWVTDWTTAGTSMLADLVPGSVGSKPRTFFNANGLVFFRVTKGTGNALAVTDGTSAGSQIIQEFPNSPLGYAPFIRNFRKVNDRVVFFVDLPDGSTPTEIWSTDGTALGTIKLGESAYVSLINDPYPSAMFGDELLYVGTDPASGSELWLTDGTDQGTRLAFELVPGPSSGYWYRWTLFDGVVYFFNSSPGSSGPEALWRSDLTTSGTYMVKDIDPNSSFENPTVIAPSASGVFFVMWTEADGGEVYFSDGTTAGTNRVSEVAAGPSGAASPRNLFPFGNGVFFTVYDHNLATELWFSDGTQAGTDIVEDLCPGFCSGLDTDDLTFYAVGGDFLFSGTDGFLGNELRRVRMGVARTHDLGMQGGSASLSASSPTLGGALMIEGRNTPPGSVGFLAMSFPVISPSNLLTDPGHALWLAPSSLTILTPVAAPIVTPEFAYSLTLPNDIALVGAQVNIQTVYFPNGAPPLETSNGLSMFLGL